MKINSLLFLIFLSLNIFSQQRNIIAENSDKITNSTVNGFDFTLNTADIQFVKVNTTGGEFYRILSSNYGKSIVEGMPELPVFKRLMEIPADADVQIIIKEQKTEIIDLKTMGINGLIIPHQPSAAKSDNRKQPFVYNKTAYRQNKFLGYPLVKSEYLGILRNMHLARFSISPFSYNPVSGKLKIVREIKVSVRFINGDIEKTRKLKRNTFSGYFPVPEVINHKAFMHIVPTAYPFAETYVIVADSMFSNTLQPFIKMKKRQGFKIIESYTQDTAVGNTTTSIKAYLQGLYTGATSSNPAPSYALLVGDVSKIPAFSGIASTGHITDLYYFEYTGDDFPELYYGRFSCDDTVELHNIIEKTLEYEQYQMPDGNYLDTAVLVAGYDSQNGPTYGNGQVNYCTSTYYNAAHGIVAKSYLYPNSSNMAAQIRQDASDGASLLNYSAHGSYNGWTNPSFKNSDVQNMTNTHKYNVMIANACLTAKFEKNDCFAEVQTNAGNKGAVGYIGASDFTYWDEDFYWAVGYSSISATPSYSSSGQGIFDGIFHDHGESRSLWSLSLGQITQKGNLAVTQGGSRVKYYWEVYHVFGDPALIHYSYKPAFTTPSYNAILSIGLDTYNVTTVPYSLVALSVNDSLIASAYADSLGVAILHFTAFTQPAQALLTITGQNKIPFTSVINVITPNSPYLAYDYFTINDSTGNNNQRADNGDSIKLNVRINNLTNYITGGVTAILSTADTNVIITDSTETINYVQGYDSLMLTNAFAINIKQGIKDDHDVLFNLSINDTAGRHWSYIFYMKLYAPEIVIGKMTIDDNLGNGNGVPEPGESVIFKIEIRNPGSNNAINGTSHLTPQSAVIVGNTTVQTDTVFKDSSYVLSFPKVIDSGSKTGDVCKMKFNITTKGYNLSKDFYAVIGRVDEDFETGDFSKFKWHSYKGNSWTIDTVNKYEGKYSARSAAINDDDTSSLIITMNVLSDDSISFYRMISSEMSYDYLYFFIDGMLMGRWSGSGYWQQMKYPVTKGKHSFKWMYVKDNYGNSGYDAAWVDYIEFPPTDALTSVTRQEPLFNNVKLYPNPSVDNPNLIFNIKENSNIVIELYSHDGKRIRNLHERQQFHKGSNSMVISTGDLKAGLYFIVLKAPDAVYTLKMIKL